MGMEVRLDPELEGKLSRIAEQQGRSAESLVEEAVARIVKHDEWFGREVDKGLEDVKQGKLIDEDEIREMIYSRYPG